MKSEKREKFDPREVSPGPWSIKEHSGGCDAEIFDFNDEFVASCSQYDCGLIVETPAMVSALTKFVYDVNTLEDLQREILAHKELLQRIGVMCCDDCGNPVLRENCFICTD